MRRRAALLFASGITMTGCGPRQPALQPYGLVDPDVLLATFPGPPRRLKSDAAAPASPEAMGYQLSGDLLVAAVIVPKRRLPALNDYDAALTVVLMVAPTPARAAQAYGSQAREDKLFFGRMAAVPIGWTPPLDASEASAWAASSPQSQVVVLARYQNYVFRFVGGIAAGELFPTQEDFLAALRLADAHVVRTLGASTATTRGS